MRRVITLFIPDPLFGGNLPYGRAHSPGSPFTFGLFECFDHLFDQVVPHHIVSGQRHELQARPRLGARAGQNADPLSWRRGKST